MLNVSTDNICRLIELAREFQAQEEVSFPEELGNPSGDWATQILASHADDDTVREFSAIVRDLEPDQQQEVVALLWLGRGDYSEDEWDDAVAMARDSWNLRTAEYLIAHPILPDYLAEGLILLGYSCESTTG
ncbi:MAG TPA: DUF3775 domain-containing protein [Pseudomonadales bacterium]|nr:DUF3775 domain-containing protein [Pseudomonadales bacterium]